VTEHTELVGAPPYADWRVCLTVGSTAALEQTLRMLCDGPGRRDTVLTEEFSFSTALETAAPMGVGVVGVAMDGEGLVPEKMEEVLRGWDPAERGGRRRPHVLYTVPSGQNPTGATQGEGRRRAIYEVARRWDVFVVEDEPYYYLQMLGGKGKKQPRNGEEFLEGLIPSYLSMDVDGRVLRMDSFSKVVVPGSRLGWVTASEQIVERFIRHAEVANQGPSGFSQVILHKLLDERWGHEGYLQWLMNLSLEYTKRRDVMVAACEELLPKEVVSWQVPQAGMFVSFLSLFSSASDNPPRTPSSVTPFLACLLTNDSNGSKSTTNCTRRPRPRASSRSRRRFSTAASRRRCLLPAGPGSVPSRTRRCLDSTSGPRLLRPRPRTCGRPSGGWVRPSGRATRCDSSSAASGESIHNFLDILATSVVTKSLPSPKPSQAINTWS
jgi:aspartate/methionine/tyrosine aminotransferase